MSAAEKLMVSPREYLLLDSRAAHKSEYYDGEIFAMAGSSPEHSLIASNLGREIGNRLLQWPCRVFQSDLRVKIEATGLYTYPDVTIVCGEPQYEDVDGIRTLLNPTVIVEVLSDTTEGYDRGAKFFQYASIPSLRDYVLVAQDCPRVERFSRQGPGAPWDAVQVNGRDGEVYLPGIDCTISLAGIYHQVDFPVSRDRSA